MVSKPNIIQNISNLILFEILNRKSIVMYPDINAAVIPINKKTGLKFSVDRFSVINETEITPITAGIDIRNESLNASS